MERHPGSINAEIAPEYASALPWLRQRADGQAAAAVAERWLELEHVPALPNEEALTATDRVHEVAQLPRAFPSRRRGDDAGHMIVALIGRRANQPVHLVNRRRRCRLDPIGDGSRTSTAPLKVILIILDLHGGSTVRSRDFWVAGR
jgi:hypothetical protein